MKSFEKLVKNEISINLLKVDKIIGLKNIFYSSQLKSKLESEI